MGEWACLGILATGRAHGFAVAARLKPTGDVGRVWSMSRPLTYRALDQLAAQGLIRPVGEEPEPKSFVVESSAEEQKDPGVDKEALEAMAAASGGKVLELPKIGAKEQVTCSKEAVLVFKD